MLEYIRDDESGKIIIPVPEKLRYISDWVEFSLDLFGKEAYIIDKQIPGCGFTEYCLINKDDLILCAPRKILLDNKQNQHPDDVLYVRNELEVDTVVDEDLNKRELHARSIKADADAEEEAKESETEEDRLTAKQKMKQDLKDYCFRRTVKGLPKKIIVTYDSFKYVKEFLEESGSFQYYKIVVDEFQSIFVDSRFKASTEIEFFTILQTISSPICFVSATPMIDKYLKQLDYFKNIPYYELDWGMKDPSRVMRPELKVRKSQSIYRDIKEVIQDYLDGKFAVLANPLTGQPVQSKEAVFYVNSVNDILKVIKGIGLKPDQVNILCSNTPPNQKKLKKRLGKKFQIGTVPLRGEPHKMFTFCTRTVYLGADFYSTNARTFVLSDANIDSLAVDISMDLPQILGRQRLIENPWKNHAEFYFKTLGNGKEITKKDFDDRIADKIEKSNSILETFLGIQKADSKEVQVQLCLDSIRFSRYSWNYVSINNIGGSKEPVMNNLVLIAEQRAYDIQQIDYKNRFTVFNTIKSENLRMDKITSFIDYLRDPINGKLCDRLKLLCETQEFSEDEKRIIAQQTSEKFDKYYNLLGPERCKAHGYSTDKINREIQDKLMSVDDIKEEFYKEFQVGRKYSNIEAKNRVKELYFKIGLNRSPKAKDIGEYFNIKTSKVKLDDGSWVHGIEILSIK